MSVPNKQNQAYVLFKNICNEDNEYEWFYEIGNKRIREIEDKVETEKIESETENTDGKN